ncbi:hypothetical protein FO519_007088 [Halicephalobus sp. NKZ332]|nr:hypothetical protein FO519_007088 [Halicephalobus sp. NKZ332]
MGKKTKKLIPKQISPRNFVENGSQTDELEQLCLESAILDETSNPPTSSTDFCDLTKEQLILRLRIAQELNARQQRALEKSENSRRQQKQVIQELCHKVKMLVIEHRDNHSEFKRIIANLVTVFANGRKELAERLEELRITTEEDKKQMRDSVASNEVATTKAKTAVKIANDEINEMIKQLEKVQLKIEKVEKDRVFIKQQYDELVDKRNQQIITQDFLCPKCKATKKCLDDVLDDLKATREMKKKVEEDSKNNLEDGEVVEDEEQDSEVEKKPSKRPAEESPGKNKKPKTIDYVYIIDEEPPPPLMNPNPVLHRDPMPQRDSVPYRDPLPQRDVVPYRDPLPQRDPVPYREPLLQRNPVPQKNLLPLRDPVPLRDPIPLRDPVPLRDPRTSWRSLSPERLQVPSLYPEMQPRRPGYHGGFGSPRRPSPTPGPSEGFFGRPQNCQVKQNPMEQYGNPMQRYRPAVNYPANGALPWHDPARQGQPRYPNRGESWTGWRR